MTSIASTNNVDLSNAVSLQIAKKALETQKQQGQAALQLLQQAAETARQPVFNGRVDVRA